MKVLMLNGSPHVRGNTALALAEMEKIFADSGVDCEIVQVGSQPVRGCVACGYCAVHGKCVVKDQVNEVAEKLRDADALVVASPVYYGSANSSLTAFLDRLFFSASCDLRMKLGASVVVCRRGGASAAFDQLNKYFTISNMPVVSSQYWNSVHGRAQGEAAQDAEGLQTVRVLARNMVFLMKSVALGRERFGLPEEEEHLSTHFIR